MPIIKVWSVDHTGKKAVCLSETSIKQLLEKANAKGIWGKKVFLIDGTEIDENEAITEYKENPFLVGDEYTYNAVRRHSTDSASTSTVSSLPSPSSIKSNSSSNVNSAFVIPYDKFPNSLLAKLNDDKTPIRNSEVNALIRIVAQELSYHHPHPTRSLSRIIARELFERYPCLYDRHEATKELIGLGYNTVFKKIEERIHYIERPNYLPGNSGIYKRKIKGIKNLSAGCIDWEPDTPKEETPESIRREQNMMSAYYQKLHQA